MIETLFPGRQSKRRIAYERRGALVARRRASVGRGGGRRADAGSRRRRTADDRHVAEEHRRRPSGGSRAGRRRSVRPRAASATIARSNHAEGGADRRHRDGKEPRAGGCSGAAACRASMRTNSRMASWRRAPKPRRRLPTASGRRCSTSEGGVDRRRLGPMVFADASAPVGIWSAIVHPAVYRAIAAGLRAFELVEACASRGRRHSAAVTRPATRARLRSRRSRPSAHRRRSATAADRPADSPRAEVDQRLGGPDSRPAEERRLAPTCDRFPTRGQLRTRLDAQVDRDDRSTSVRVA